MALAMWLGREGGGTTKRHWIKLNLVPSRSYVPSGSRLQRILRWLKRCRQYIKHNFSRFCSDYLLDGECSGDGDDGI